MSLAGNLAVLLKSAGLENVVEGQLPATPDEVIMVRATSGAEPLRTHGSAAYAQPRAQIIVRAKTYATAEARADLAWRTMFRTNVTLDGVRYLSIHPIDSPMDVGADEQTPPRRLFSFNMQILKEV